MNGTTTCLHCGKPLAASQPKYCSSACWSRHTSKASGAKFEARIAARNETLKPILIGAYHFGLTLRQIGDHTGLTKQAISKLLKQWGSFDASRTPKQKQKGYNGHIKPHVMSIKSAYFIISKDMDKERRLAWKMDDCQHWTRHVVCRNHLIYKRNVKDPMFRIKSALRSRIHKTVIKQGYTKSDRTLTLVGCTIGELRLHLQSQFALGMAWNNYGLWEIDHVIPCSAFDLSDPQQQNECYNWRNLQPLWKSDNIRKGGTNRLCNRHLLTIKKVNRFLV